MPHTAPRVVNLRQKTDSKITGKFAEARAVFENCHEYLGADAEVDKVVVVTVAPEIQRARVLARPNMTSETVDRLISKQMPDAEKRARADYVIETTTLEDARRSVHKILREIRGERDA